jgi:hypothetical protein
VSFRYRQDERGLCVTAPLSAHGVYRVGVLRGSDAEHPRGIFLAGSSVSLWPGRPERAV